MSQLLEIGRFGLIGVAAMLIHLFVVWLSVTAGLYPLTANVLGFVVAFQASYFGHCRFTFNESPRLSGYWKMLSVSTIGFLFNELAYYLVLTRTSFDYRVSLTMILIVTAAGTFLAAKCWVFVKKKNKQREGPEASCNTVANDMKEEKEAWRQITQNPYL